MKKLLHRIAAALPRRHSPAVAEQGYAKSMEGVRADLRALQWGASGLTVEGWVTVGGRKRKPPESLTVWAVAASTRGDASHDPGVGRPLKTLLRTGAAPHLHPHTFVDSDADLDTAAFSATLSPEDWVDAGEVQIVVEYGDSGEVTPFTHRYRWGSAGHLRAHMTGGERLAPRWDGDHGLLLARSKPAAFTSGTPEITDRQAALHLSLVDGFNPVSAEWVLEDDVRSAALTITRTQPGHARVDVGDGPFPDVAGNWAIRLIDSAGRRRALHWGDSSWDAAPLRGDAALERFPGGLVRLVVGPASVYATTIEPCDGAVEVHLASNARQSVAGMVLRGTRADIHGVPTGAGSFLFDLAQLSWRSQTLAPPAGGYRLWAVDVQGADVPVKPSPALSQSTPRTVTTAQASVRVEHAPDGQAYLDISAPLQPHERGRFHRRRLANMFTGEAAADTAPDGVFLESWYGKTVSDNPAAVIDALRGAGVAGPYRVAIADRSVEFPDATEPVIVGSEEYWRALGSSRLIVTNTWLPGEFSKRPGQFVVQTWHGTPLKTLGMDVPRRAGSDGAAQRLRKGSANWDLLLSQNAYSTEIFRRAYLFDGRVAEVGYPRNDLLRGQSAVELRAAVRQTLGLPDSAIVSLYAPTWRADDKGSLGPLDLGSLLQKLSPDHVILARGHSVTLRRGRDVQGDSIIDVTSYPEPAELIAASDVLITDYSSIMFDFAVTGRPILYFTPDYEEYMGEGRGGYFNLSERAPGPQCSTEDELVRALKTVSAGTWTADPRYNDWQRTFVPHDDGSAGARLAAVIAEMLAQCPEEPAAPRA